MPLIGQFIKKDPDLLIGTGYNTWGMTNAVLAGNILSDLILNKENKYQSLFLPYRPMNLKKVKSLIENTIYNTKSFILSKVQKYHNWYHKRVRIERRNGKTVGIYIDEKNKEHVVSNICPHLKCSLFFNFVSKTWDCPCHGSKFDIDGNRVHGPSIYNIKMKE